jgi:purine-binding chemotaxis protein CheW
MKNYNWYLVIEVAEIKLALVLNHVESVISAVYLQPVPNVPEYIMGAINYHGDNIPLINIRTLFSLPPKEIELTDHFVILRSGNKMMAIWVDKAVNTIHKTIAKEIRNDAFYINNKLIEGVLQLNDEIILLNDVDKLITSKAYQMFNQQVLVENSIR